MKSFAEHLQEGEKTYEFRLKFAGLDLDSTLLTKIEAALAEFDLKSISKAKRLPVQNHPLYFPTLGPCEVNLVDVVLNYPATDEIVRQTIVTRTRIPGSNLLVIPRNAPELLMRDETDKKRDTKSKALLTSKDDPVEQAELFGDEYNTKLIKSIPTRKFEFAKPETVKPKRK